MDPLSLAGTIAGLAGSMLTAVSSIYSYSTSVKNASSAQAEIARELSALAQTLLQMNGVILGCDASSPQYPQASVSLLLSLDDCKKDVQELQIKFEKMKSHGKVKSTIDRLKWPLDEEENTKSLQKLARYRGLFQAALTVDTWGLLKHTFSDIQAFKEGQESSERNADDQKTLEWLEEIASDPQIRLQGLTRETIPDTGKWLLESPEFTRFASGSESTSLWCHGLPGAGKTYLSAIVVNYLSRTDHSTSTVVYWYFDYLQADKLHPEMFCATLLKQVADSFPHLPSKVKEFHRKYKKVAPLLSDLSAVLFSLLDEIQRPFIIIDALDECLGKYLDRIKDMITKFPRHGARVFVTSRPHVDCPPMRTRNWKYALEYAVQRSQDAVKLLLKHEADIHARGGQYCSIVHAAAQSRNKEMVKMVLGLGAHVMEDEKYDGLLHVATHHHQLLIDHGANVNAPGKHGTHLQAAILNLHKEEETVLNVITLLIDAGADVNKCGGRYEFPLQAAARCGLETVTDKLLENGALPCAKGGRYGYALEAAAYSGNDAVVDALLEHGADVNEMGGKYGTAIQAAAFGGHEAVVQLLLKKGADVGLCGGKFHSPLRAAKQKMTTHNKVVAQILSENGAVDNTKRKRWRKDGLSDSEMDTDEDK